MKIAIVHDYLMEYGGAEKVLESLHELYPEATIFVAIYNKKRLGKFSKNFENAKIIESWFGKLPFADKLISPLRFLLPLVWGSLDLAKFDLIIDSSSWAITRGFKTRDNQIEICYCHTPPRYLYGFDTSRNWDKSIFKRVIDFYSLIVNHFMRIYDFNSAQKVDYFIANSNNIAARIEKFYRKNSTVIYPPVDISSSKKSLLRVQASSHSFLKNQEYFLTGGRFVAAKNFDLIIKACKKANVKLKIFGAGILDQELRKIAANNIEFLGKISDSEKAEYYQNAKGFIVAQQDEDFGITTVEAQGLGCPVIAFRGGGYLETVIENTTGIFFDKLEVDDLVNAIKRFDKVKWNKKILYKNADRFSEERFQKEIKEFVNSKLK